jgi:hypothetical protein
LTLLVKSSPVESPLHQPPLSVLDHN